MFHVSPSISTVFCILFGGPRDFISLPRIESMVGMLVPLSSVGSVAYNIYNPPIGRKNATYIPLIYCLLRGLYVTYHLLREPETTID